MTIETPNSPHFIEARHDCFAVCRKQSNGQLLTPFAFHCSMSNDDARDTAFLRACGLRDTLNRQIIKLRAA